MKPDKLNLEVGAATETGYVRHDNQDRMSWAHVPFGQLYIVADGMGGHAGGAMAAELTVQGLEKNLSTTTETIRIENAIRDAFDKTNKDIYDKAHAGNPETDGMGSTAVMLLVFGQIAKIAHVGDSRAYLYRDGKLRLLTKDHTQVQRMVDAGMLTAEEARNHPSANLLDRAIGHRPTITLDISSDLVLKEGDGIVLCSDGLSGYVDDQEIEAAVDNSLTAQEIADRLVNQALQKGGEDNVTVQFVRYGHKPEVQNGNRNTLLKLFFVVILGVGLAGSVFLTSTQAGKSVTTTIAQLLSPFQQKIDKGVQKNNSVNNIDEQIKQLQASLSARDSELQSTKSLAQQSINKTIELEEQLKLANLTKKTLESQLTNITQEKNTAEQLKLIANQKLKELKEKNFVLKKKLNALQLQIRLLEELRPNSAYPHAKEKK